MPYQMSMQVRPDLWSSQTHYCKWLKLKYIPHVQDCYSWQNLWSILREEDMRTCRENYTLAVKRSGRILKYT